MSCDPPATPMPPRSSLLDVFIEGMNLPTSPLGIIYGGKIVETVRSDLKTTQKRKFGLF